MNAVSKPVLTKASAASAKSAADRSMGERKTRRDRRPSPSNEDFLRSAIKLFREHGYERTSLAALALEGGIAKRSIYLRYGDKLSLFKAAIAWSVDEWILPIERLRAQECDNLEQTLLAVGRLLVENILSPEGLRMIRLANAESVHIPEISAYCVKIGTEPTIAYLAEMLDRKLGGEGCSFGPAREAAEAFLYLVVGAPANLAAWGVNEDPAALEKRVRYSVQLFLNGVDRARTE